MIAKIIPIEVIVNTLLVCSLFFISLNCFSQNADATFVNEEIETVHPNDVSILYPLPESIEDATSLITIGHLTSVDDNTAVFPENDFNRILEVARAEGKVANRAITFRNEIEAIDAWKVAGIRFDPSAPGSSDDVINAFGIRPQIRLVVQPVTIGAGRVEVHDVTIHVIYDYVITQDPSVRALPVADSEKMMAIIDGLIELRKECEEQGEDTSGALSVHPCLKESTSDFHVELVMFLRTHLHSSRFQGAAIMGLNQGAFEPWIFLALNRQLNGEFSAFPNPGLGSISAQGVPPAAQMISFLPGDNPNVQPTPSTTNVLPVTVDLGIPKNDRRGVSTAPLFNGVDLDSPASTGFNSRGEEIFSDSLKNSDIVDWIANPEKAHFFNTDCLSCHTETTRRLALNIREGEFAFEQSHEEMLVDSNLLHADRWNVRNFGWFVNPLFGSKQTTITQRTANETFEVVEFINELLQD